MNRKYFYCYSHPLKDYLITHGLTYVIKGIHPDTQKRYWVFDRDDPLLDKFLNEWKNNKQ